MSAHGAATPASAALGAVGKTGTHVVFSVDETRYSLPVEAVHRTLPLPQLTRLPTSDPAVLGVFQLLGTVITVWDARRWLRAGNDPPNHPWLVLVDFQGTTRAILVDRVIDVLTLSDYSVNERPARPSALAAAAYQGVLEAPLMDDPSAAVQAGDPASPTRLDPDEAEHHARVVAAQTLASLSPVYCLRLEGLFAEDG